MGLLCLAPLGLQAAPAAPVFSPLARVSVMTVGTLFLVLWIAVIWWTRRAILNKLHRLAVNKTRNIPSTTFRRMSVHRVTQLTRIGTRIATIALVLAGLFLWATLLLDLTPTTHDFAAQLEQSIFLQLQTLLLAAVGTIPDLAVIAVVYLGAYFLHEMLNHYFRAVSNGEIQSAMFDQVTAETTRRLANLGVWVAAIIIAFPYIPGSNSAAFRGVSVLAGLMLSLGSANLVGQFASGLSLIYGRSLRPGEYVKAGDVEGEVEQIGWFACKLRTGRDELVVLPHSIVSAGLKNYSRGTGGVRCSAEINIGYDTPWRKVRELLLAASNDTPGIRAEPAPTVRQASLDDHYVRYELLFTPDEPRHTSLVLGRLHEAIQDRFHAAGLQIMSPHYESDPVAPKIPAVTSAPHSRT